MMTIANVHQFIASAKQCNFGLLGSRAHSIAYHPHSYIPSHPLWQGRTCPGGTTNPGRVLQWLGMIEFCWKDRRFLVNRSPRFFQLPIPSNQGRSSPILKWLATIPHAVGDLRDLRNLSGILSLNFSVSWLIKSSRFPKEKKKKRSELQRPYLPNLKIICAPAQKKFLRAEPQTTPLHLIVQI